MKKAVFYGHVEVIRLLLSWKARTDLQDCDGRSALMKAKVKATAKLLLDNGVQVDVQDDDGSYALLEAIEGRCYDVAELLLEYGANAEILSDDGESALMIFERKTGSDYVSL